MLLVCSPASLADLLHASVGWGVYLTTYISLAVINSAIAGRSACSFTRQGRFDAMLANVKSEDYMVIEFGHNDGGSLTPTDNGRSDCTPVGTDHSTTCTTVYWFVVVLLPSLCY